MSNRNCARVEEKIEILEKRLKRIESETIPNLKLKILDSQRLLDLLFDQKIPKEKFDFCQKTFQELGLEINNVFDFELLRKHDAWEAFEMDELEFKYYIYYFVMFISLSENIPNRTFENRECIPICNRSFFFEFEREKHMPSLGYILERLNRMADYKFGFSKIEDITFPLDGIKFTYQDKNYEWIFDSTNNWSGWKFFEKFKSLPGIVNPQKDLNLENYFWVGMDAGLLIGYLTNQNIEKLLKVLGNEKDLMNSF